MIKLNEYVFVSFKFILTIFAFTTTVAEDYLQDHLNSAAGGNR